jgi:hypothetical protein
MKRKEIGVCGVVLTRNCPNLILIYRSGKEVCIRIPEQLPTRPWFLGLTEVVEFTNKRLSDLINVLHSRQLQKNDWRSSA